MKSLSIVVPVRNEEKNIIPLISRIHLVLKKARIVYQIIFIDDHSTDNTVKKINFLKKLYPISVFSKQGKQGKAQSLVEGFARAKYKTLAMIDGDLQYSPTVIPRMFQKIEQGAGIVIANRKRHRQSIRDISSKLFNITFCRLLHQLPFDVQSGLKVFKKEIIERKQLNPLSQWMFDLELLLLARDSGYSIKSVPIKFSERKFGNTKVKLASTAIEMAIASLILKFKQNDSIPFNLEEINKLGEGFHHQGKQFIPYTKLRLTETAFKRFTFQQKILIVSLILITLLFGVLQFHITVIVIFSIITSLYFIDLLFYLFLANSSFFRHKSLHFSSKEVHGLIDEDLPVYTVLCPLYKEWEVVGEFTKSISSLDYPKNKLQVILLLEEDDKKTIREIKKMKLPEYFETVIVPHSLPKTKPKALNFGLRQAKGEYVVVYDAEDSPQKDQLKKAILAFQKLGESVLCVQAKLNYYNTDQNLLTRLFSLEYSLWFDLILLGLQAIDAPIPLGGTSNHFKLENVKNLYGWDPFNVTEDADLGIRIFKKGYKTAILDSYTYEEATSEIGNWLKQRTRWIKGYMQTYFVHIRKPQEFSTDIRNPHIITFHLILGGKIISLIVNPFLWTITILYFAFRPVFGSLIDSFFPSVILYLGVFSLAIGNFLYIYFYFLAAAKKNQWNMVPFAFLVPFYWLLISAASLNAAREFLVNPHYWNKTKHGRLIKEKEIPFIEVNQETLDRKVQISYARP